VAHARTSQLARAQAAAVRAAGGVPVPLAQLLAPKFRAAPDVMFSADGYHPSATAYALAADALLVTVLDALGIEDTTPDDPAPADTPVLGPAHTRASVMTWLRRRPLPRAANPVVAAAGRYRLDLF
jgi:hypothetical protein